MKLKNILLISLILLSVKISAQKKWTIEDCINYAIENNIQLKQSAVNSEIAKNNYNQSKVAFLPDLNGFGNHYQNWGKTFSYDLLQYIDQNYYEGNFGVSANLNIFNGLNSVYTLVENKYRYLASKEDTEVQEDYITIQVVLGFLQVLFDQEMLTVAKDQYEITKEQVAKTEQQVRVGSLAKSSLLEIQSQLAMEKVNLTNASNKLSQSKLHLKQLLYLDKDEDLTITISQEVNLAEESNLEKIDTIYNYAEKNLPEIKAAQYRLLSSKYALKKAKYSRLPTISASGVYFTRYSETAIHPSNYDNNPSNDVMDYLLTDQIQDFAYRQVNLSIRIPIFQKWTIQTRINNSKLDYLNSDYELEQQKLDVYNTIQQAHQDAEGAFQRYQANIEAVESSEAAFNATKQKYEMGLVDVIEYNTAKNNYTKAQSDLLQAKYEFMLRSKILDFYMGNDFII